MVLKIIVSMQVNLNFMAANWISSQIYGSQYFYLLNWLPKLLFHKYIFGHKNNLNYNDYVFSRKLLQVMYLYCVYYNNKLNNYLIMRQIDIKRSIVVQLLASTFIYWYLDITPLSYFWIWLSTNRIWPDKRIIILIGYHIIKILQWLLITFAWIK